MSEKMKLIMENWRKNTILVEARIQTLGEMAATINAILQVKAGEDAATVAYKLAKIGTAGLADLASLGLEVVQDPEKFIEILASGLGIAEGAVELITTGGDLPGVIRKAASLPDGERSKAGYLAMLDMDDKYLEIISNDLEQDFLVYLLKKVEEGVQNNTPLEDFNVNKILEDFIKEKYQGYSIDGANLNPFQARNIKKRGVAKVAGVRGIQKFKKGIKQ